MQTIESLVENYFQKMLFIFLPNICNASCYFCYVEPTFAHKGVLTPQLLGAFDKFVALSSQLGFREYRFTGGEPLIFDNFEEIIAILNKYDVDYTLLSNGLNLHKYSSFLKAYKPKKVSISYHSLENYAKIFGVKHDRISIEKEIVELQSASIPVSITMLLLPENLNEIQLVVSHFAALGVKAFKFIYPNTSKALEYFEVYKKITQTITYDKDIIFRITDDQMHTCMLKDRGFLSVSMPHFDAYSCCITVGEGDKYPIGEITKSNISDVLLRIFDHSQNMSSFPCKSYLPFCPIGLRDKSPLENKYS